MKMILTGLFTLFFILSSTQAYAKSRSIAGYWKGGGSITTSSGNRERTRCRATIRARNAIKYSVVAACSVAGFGIVKQSGTIRRISKNRYRGNFTNYDYGIHGSITVVHHGNRQHVTFRSPKGRASVTLRRRR